MFSMPKSKLIELIKLAMLAIKAVYFTLENNYRAFCRPKLLIVKKFTTGNFFCGNSCLS